MPEEKQELQRYGRNKETSINHAYVECGEYRNKFDKISENQKLNRFVYQIAKEMLLHRTGTLYEDMYWIDIDNIKWVAREINQNYIEKIVYSKATKRTLKKLKNNNLLVIHTHPSSMPPSINDFNSFVENRYTIGVVCCHDGKVFMYGARKYINEIQYKFRIAKYLNIGYNIYEAQMKVIEFYILQGDIFCKEVLEDEKI